MIISHEDAFGLLSKWNSESSPLFGIASIAEFGLLLSFWGSIVHLQEAGFMITELGKVAESGHKVFELMVSTASPTSFEYGDLREAPPDIQTRFSGRVLGSLVIKLPHGGFCMILEMDRATSKASND